MMKILHVYNLHRSGGGADNAALDLVQLLKQQGIEVEVFARDSRVIPDTLFGKISTFYSCLYPAGTIRKFRAVLREFQPTVVHVHELYPLISPWVLPECKKMKIPVVMTCYDYRLTCPIATHFHNGKICTECLDKSEFSALFNNCRQNILESLAYALRNMIARKRRLYLDYVDRFIVLNEFSQRWFSNKLGMDPGRFNIIGCVVNPHEVAVKPSQGAYIAYAGRFAREKGIHVLVDAMQKVDANLLIIGYEDNLPAFNSPRITVKKTQFRHELVELYRNAKMLIMPSIWFETFGIVAAEAMSHGVPVLASEIGALEFTVKHNVSGLLFKTGDSDSLASAINTLLADPGMNDLLGEGAYNQVKTEYSQTIILNKILQCYREVTTNDA